MVVKSWQASVFRILIFGLFYLTVLILTGELRWRPGGAAIYLTILWSCHAVVEFWGVYRSRHHP